MLAKSQQHQQDMSRELQRRLYLAAKRSRNRRFHALYDRIVRPDILWRAWEEVRANRGAPGIDGLSIEDVESSDPEEYLAELARDLKAHRYRPNPALRVQIPKPDGRMRPLGIPTVRDRVVQQATKIVIEPIFEANFLDCSYGYRPKRSAAQAVLAVKEALVRNWWVLDADIEGFFDSVDHEILMGLLMRRISDRKVLKLIDQWLRSGVVIEGRRQTTPCGVPQGGVISPLLANIYLHTLDRWWQDRHTGLGQLHRYCDDFVVICKRCDAAKRAQGLIAGFLRRLKLDLHPAKTHVVGMDRGGFDFLGFHFHKLPSKRTGRLVPYAWPSQKAMAAVRAKIREQTERTRLRVDLSELIAALNQIIRGWRAYFSIGNSTKKLADLDRYVRFRLWRFLTKRQGPRGRLRPEGFVHWLRRCGLIYFYPTGRRGHMALHAAR
jgi:group II intron reverse transcriptase/maturase